MTRQLVFQNSVQSQKIVHHDRHHNRLHTWNKAYHLLRRGEWTRQAQLRTL